MDLWRAAYSTIFPQDTSSGKQDMAADPAADPKFKEAAIDAARVQKDEELERYRKQAEKKARELAQKAAASGESESTREGPAAATADGPQKLSSSKTPKKTSSSTSSSSSLKK